MNKVRRLKDLLGIIVLLSFTLGANSCAQQAETFPRVWIDSPIDGALISSGETVTVLSHAYAQQGVAEVVLTVNGVAYRRDAPSSVGAQYAQVNQDWQPGVYG